MLVIHNSYMLQRSRKKKINGETGGLSNHEKPILYKAKSSFLTSHSSRKSSKTASNEMPINKINTLMDIKMPIKNGSQNKATKHHLQTSQLVLCD